jgi:hypothetical protein
MAFASGKKSTEGASFKHYIGVGSCFVLALNPNKAELSSLYGTEITNDPSYLSEVEINGNKIPSVRLDFILKTDVNSPFNNGIEFTSKATFFLRKEPRYNKDATKCQVIDKYGRTAWVTIEQAKNHEIPVYSNGPAKICPDYRVAYVGEEDLVNFLIAYLGIPGTTKRQADGNYIEKTAEELVECEAGLEKIKEYFKGDFSELRNIIALQPENKVKVMFGIKNNDGKQIQTVYTNMFLKSAAPEAALARLATDLENRKANGAYPNCEFAACKIKEYSVEATDLAEVKNDTSDLPFQEGNGASNESWF